MTKTEIIDFIDEFLSKQEDVLHGDEGRDCTKSRKYLNILKEQLQNLHPSSGELTEQITTEKQESSIAESSDEIGYSGEELAFIEKVNEYKSSDELYEDAKTILKMFKGCEQTTIDEDRFKKIIKDKYMSLLNQEDIKWEL